MANRDGAYSDPGTTANVRPGSFTTETAGSACHCLSASPRKRPRFNTTAAALLSETHRRIMNWAAFAWKRQAPASVERLGALPSLLGRRTPAQGMAGTSHFPGECWTPVSLPPPLIRSRQARFARCLRGGALTARRALARRASGSKSLPGSPPFRRNSLRHAHFRFAPQTSIQFAPGLIVSVCSWSVAMGWDEAGRPSSLFVGVLPWPWSHGRRRTPPAFRRTRYDAVFAAFPPSGIAQIRRCA